MAADKLTFHHHQEDDFGHDGRITEEDVLPWFAVDEEPAWLREIRRLELEAGRVDRSRILRRQVIDMEDEMARLREELHQPREAARIREQEEEDLSALSAETRQEVELLRQARDIKRQRESRALIVLRADLDGFRGACGVLVKAVEENTAATNELRQQIAILGEEVDEGLRHPPRDRERAYVLVEKLAQLLQMISEVAKFVHGVRIAWDQHAGIFLQLFK